jgi:hypothetical protein
VLRYALLIRDHYCGSDFRLYYGAASIGVHHGWSRIYGPAVLTCGPPKPFLNPPPMAWLALPFTALDYHLAYAAWSVFCAAALASATALLLPTWRLRLVGGAVALALYPTLFALYLGQASIFVLLAVAACWRLLEAGHEVWAGAALALAVVKPQMAMLLPLALLVALLRRTFAAWVLATLGLAVLSALSLGPQGIAQYLALASHPLPEDWVYTPAGLLGRGPLTLTLQTGFGVVALAAAYRNRQRRELVFAVGLVGSALAAPYWHVQDFLAVIAAAALMIVGRRTAASLLFAGAVFVAANPVWVGGTFKPAWLEVGLWLVLEVAFLTWLLFEQKERAPAGTGALVEQRAS